MSSRERTAPRRQHQCHVVALDTPPMSVWLCAAPRLHELYMIYQQCAARRSRSRRASSPTRSSASHQLSSRPASTPLRTCNAYAYTERARGLTTHNIALQHIALQYITWPYIASRHRTYIRPHCNTTHCIVVQWCPLHYVVLHCASLHYDAMHRITLHYMASLCTVHK